MRHGVDVEPVARRCVFLGRSMISDPALLAVSYAKGPRSNRARSLDHATIESGDDWTEQRIMSPAVELVSTLALKIARSSPQCLRILSLHFASRCPRPQTWDLEWTICTDIVPVRLRSCKLRDETEEAVDIDLGTHFLRLFW